MCGIGGIYFDKGCSVDKATRMELLNNHIKGLDVRGGAACGIVFIKYGKKK